MVILALDVGEARIGVAVSDPTETLATPRGVIRRRSTATALDAIVQVVSEVGAGEVVVGLPISLDGALHQQARRVQALAERLRARLSVPVTYWDERLSTVSAAEALRAAGVRPAKVRERIDAAAAAVILQECLDHRRQQGPAQPSGSGGMAVAPAEDEAEEPGQGRGGSE
jgi:putative Holliday junction resolvase